uniref:Uncharacterized protein n=1 Tax=Triticum urartu TaxID=4572 RepID=A0A8R7Q1H6_TRIUA
VLLDSFGRPGGSHLRVQSLRNPVQLSELCERLGQVGGAPVLAAGAGAGHQGPAAGRRRDGGAGRPEGAPGQGHP